MSIITLLIPIKQIKNTYKIVSKNGDSMVGYKPGTLRLSECGDEEQFRHYSPESQAYAPADVLLHHMREGWVIDALVAIKTFHCTSCRSINVFYFMLRRDIQTLQVPVIANPVVTRLIQECHLAAPIFPGRKNNSYELHHSLSTATQSP